MTYKKTFEKYLLEDSETILIKNENLSIFNKDYRLSSFAFYKLTGSCYHKIDLSQDTAFLCEDNKLPFSFDEKSRFLSYYESRYCGVKEKLLKFFNISSTSIIACEEYLDMDLLLSYDEFYILRKIGFNPDMSINDLSFEDINFADLYSSFIIKKLTPNNPTLILVGSHIYHGIYPLKNNCYLSIVFQVIEDCDNKNTCTLPKDCDNCLDYKISFTPKIYTMDYFYSNYGELISLTDNFPEKFNSELCIDHILNFVEKVDYDNFNEQFESLLQLL